MGVLPVALAVNVVTVADDLGDLRGDLPRQVRRHGVAYLDVLLRSPAME